MMAVMPEEKSKVSWTDISNRLAAARIYWLHTTNRSGGPSASPVWGVVVAGQLYLYSKRSTVKARNIERDSRAVIHLESGADVVIVHGIVDDMGHPGDSPIVMETFAHKYDRADERPFLPSTNPDFDVLYALRPQRALLWTLPDSDLSTRRWARSDEREAPSDET
jgi:hypothetical protein